MKNKGFTLVELLAIIIIIGLLAVIVIPKINDSVESSKQNLAKTNALNYSKAIQEQTLKEQLNDTIIKLDGDYNINTNGNIQNENIEFNLDYSGEKPKNGYLTYSQNELQSGCITINKYAVTLVKDEVTNVEKGDCVEIAQEKINTIIRNAKNIASQVTGQTEIKDIENGWVAFINGELKAYSIRVQEMDKTYVVTDLDVNSENSNATATLSTTLASKTSTELAIVVYQLPGTVKADGAKYLTTVQEVYYNPVSGAKDCSGQEGCMHWYLYSVKGDYANMLLDHNITEVQSSSGIWVSQTDYEDSTKPATLGITYPGISSFPDYDTANGTNNKGPITALNTLKTLTTNWKTNTPMVPNSSSTNEYIIPKSQNDNKYQIDYTGYKARLITKEEAEYLGCSGNANSCPGWMIKGTSSENSTTYANIYGYWASTPSYVNSNDGTVINSDRTINKLNPTSTYRGVRPVIAVNINDVL